VLSTPWKKLKYVAESKSNSIANLPKESIVVMYEESLVINFTVSPMGFVISPAIETKFLLVLGARNMKYPKKERIRSTVIIADLFM
tara:strand:- start:3972 stop:4229 length:258 start_codon:yes stop_codon:yes gene_type:complete